MTAVSVAVLTAAVLGGSAIAPVIAAPADLSVAASEKPFADPDLVNPGRGQYRWGGLTKWGDLDG